jgi:phosphopantothenoylcysteine decarboxylase
MSKILLGVTGSVAALRTPLLTAALIDAGHQVKVVATTPALYFFRPQDLPPGVLHTDADEWPRRTAGQLFQREDPVLHIELRRWAELLLVAPLDANTLAKFAVGLCDNCLTCIWRAWDPARPRLLAPAMNTFMWEHPLTARHLRQLAELEGISLPADVTSPEALMELIHAQAAGLRFVPPISKRLACGDVGVGAMAEVAEVVAAAHQLLLPGGVTKPTP